jgi:pSer/pThr/pTyr-binding forkhead associated (FHA) protein
MNPGFEAVRLGAAAEAAADTVAMPVGPPDHRDTAVLVEGALCKNGHFNDPDLRYCQRCGISMVQLTIATRLGPRPTLGLLLFDDGTTYQLDRDYVLGRDPESDPSVRTRQARPLRVTDGSGVSRRHLAVRLLGWRVDVEDLRSANGTYVQPSDAPAPRRLDPGERVTVQPGTLVGFGRRWLRYESHRAR